MAQDESTTELVARSYFEALGYSAERIPAAKSKTPDFRFVSGSERLLVEVKSKGEDPEAWEEFFAGSGRAIRADSVEKSAAQSKIVKNAARQLSALADPKSARLLWFAPEGQVSPLLAEQFIATLYGASIIVAQKRDGSWTEIPCFYFGFSDFFRYRDLEGAMLVLGADVMLCVNPFSERLALLESSLLYGAAREAGKLCDPRLQERAQRILVADCDIDRTDWSAMRDFIRKKYGNPTMFHWVPRVVRVRHGNSVDVITTTVGKEKT